MSFADIPYPGRDGTYTQLFFNSHWSWSHIYLLTRGREAESASPHNFLDSMHKRHWFIDSSGGFPESQQHLACPSSILGHVPEHCKSATPFDIVRFEKAVTLIQNAWRRACNDPLYRVCRERLLRDFSGLARIS